MKKITFFSWMKTCRFICASIGVIQPLCGFSSESEAFDEATKKLEKIHSELSLLYGKFTEEYPEQLMTAMHLPSDAKVLELGGNMGRNSCVIASILNDSRNLVVTESCPESAGCLKENRDYNHLNFHIEASAISKVPLIQKGWDTIPSEIVLPGYVRINTITFEQLQKKYQVTFDTLVADCEGALYYILRDDPSMLQNIKLIIVENDYRRVGHKNYVAALFIVNGFKLIYNINNFYQVWRK